MLILLLLLLLLLLLSSPRPILLSDFRGHAELFCDPPMLLEASDELSWKSGIRFEGTEEGRGGRRSKLGAWRSKEKKEREKEGMRERQEGGGRRSRLTMGDASISILVQHAEDFSDLVGQELVPHLLIRLVCPPRSSF
eukprot:762044-Hanusia_phi.AAC.2